MTKKIKQEQGRSMVEMLGVLAIIGVLSVAGIAGYKSAITSHRANETIDRVLKRAVVIAGQVGLGQQADISGFHTQDGTYTIPSTVDTTTTAGQFVITVESVPEEVCQKIKDMWTLPSIVPGNCEAGTNDMTFTFANDLSAGENGGNTEPTEPTCDSAAHLVSDGNGGCECDTGYEDVDGACCPTARVCEGVCCPKGASCADGTCTCGVAWDSKKNAIDYGTVINNTCCYPELTFSSSSNGVSYDIEACGCPKGSYTSGSLKNNVCCDDRNYAWSGNGTTGDYDTVNIEACGCPIENISDPTSYKMMRNIASATQHGDICCSEFGYKLNASQTSYDVVDVATCGCPKGQNSNFEWVQGAKVNDPNVCCYQGYAFGISSDSTPKYETVNIEACGCPPGWHYQTFNIVTGTLIGEECCSGNLIFENGFYKPAPAGKCGN